MRLRRYLQVNRYGDDLEQQLRKSPGIQTEPYTGPYGSVVRPVGTLRIARRQESDGDCSRGRVEVIEFPKSAVWIAKEWVMFDRR
jgi:hypothetical protein